MILSIINIRKVTREMLKTSGFFLGFALGFQHLPRDLANVNEWKIMFDPYNNKEHEACIYHYPPSIKFVTLINKMNHNRSTDLDRSVINYWGA